MSGRRTTMTVAAFSLMSATVITNVLGLLFWALAAILAPPRVVGRASAEVAALILLSTIGQLNLNNLFVRFLPKAGDATERLVWRGYLAVVIASLAVGIAFVTSGLGNGIVEKQWLTGTLFVVAVLFLAIFALQDSVLTALRRTHWVPIENGTFSIAKFALLPVLLVRVTSARITIAWVLPVVIAVAVVTFLLATRVLPALREDGRGSLPSTRRILTLWSGEYATTLFALATLQLMPLLVLWNLGPAATAWFTLPWLACVGMSTLFWNVGTAFVVEAVTSDRWISPIRRVLLLLGMIVGAAFLGCEVVGPLILQSIGRSYAIHSVTLLRLIGLSAPFTAVTVVYGAFAWLDQKVWKLAAIQAMTGSLLIALALTLMSHLGLSAIGWAYLFAQATIAACMLPSLRARFSRSKVHPSDSRELRDAHAGDPTRSVKL